MAAAMAPWHAVANIAADSMFLCRIFIGVFWLQLCDCGVSKSMQATCCTRSTSATTSEGCTLRTFSGQSCISGQVLWNRAFAKMPLATATTERTPRGRIR